MPRLKLAVTATIAMMVLVFGQADVATNAAVQPQNVKSAAKLQVLKSNVGWQRQATWRWQLVMGAKQTRSAYHERRTTSPRYLRWLSKLWKKRHFTARQRAQNPPFLQEWLCIHRYEGSWNDPNAPYYGGLQMDMDFQRTYGWNLLQRKGTADNWTPLEQIWVAVKAHRSGRGFYPWPNTARYCGLI